MKKQIPIISPETFDRIRVSLSAIPDSTSSLLVQERCYYIELFLNSTAIKKKEILPMADFCECVTNNVAVPPGSLKATEGSGTPWSL